MALLCLGNGLTQFFPLAGRLNATATQTRLMGVFSSNGWCLHPYDVRHWLNSCDSYENFVVIDILDSALYCHHKKTNWGNVFKKCYSLFLQSSKDLINHFDTHWPWSCFGSMWWPSTWKISSNSSSRRRFVTKLYSLFLKLILCSGTYFLVIHLFFNVLGTELHVSWFLWD